MKITNSFNNNFGALFGKKETITRYYPNNQIKIRTFQYVHPFKDEFKTSEDMKKWLDSYKETSFYKRQNTSIFGTQKELIISFGPELPFTKETYEAARKDGVELLRNPDEFYSVVERHEGYFPAYTFENGNFNCII